MNNINKIVTFLIAATIEALRDIWLVGDHFLNDAFPSLQRLKSTATMLKKPPPYICEQFNVSIHTMKKHLVRPILPRILNTVIEGMNKTTKLPSFIVLVLDKDLIEQLGTFEYGMKQMLEDGLKWLMKHIRRSIDIRIDDIMQKRPGAILFTPRVVWIKMINRPFTSNHPDDLRVKTMSWRKKFNDIIDQILSSQEKTHILQIASVMEYPHKNYDRLGNLSYEGKVQFWKELDHYLKKLDREIFSNIKKSTPKNVNEKSSK